MKFFSIMLGLFSTMVIADEGVSPVTNINVYQTEASKLTIHNLSNEDVNIDIYGEVLLLLPASGLQFECLGYESLELKIDNIEHDYFAVPCNSHVVINELFTHQF